MPGHASREVLIVLGSLSTCDPGDIVETIKVYLRHTHCHYLQATGDHRWKMTLTFDGRRLCVPKFTYSTLQQTTRHW